MRNLRNLSMKIAPDIVIWVRCVGLALMSALMFYRASAQGIIYGIPPTPAYYALGEFSYNLDVNGDGSPDFVLISEPGDALIKPLGNNSLIAIPEPPPDLGSFVAALSAGIAVGSSLDPLYQWYYPNTDQFGTAAIGAQISIDNQIATLGYFFGKTAYAGFNLYYDGANHYGWMQIANPYSILAGQVLDYAYQTSPNTPIFAGEVPEPSTLALLALSGVFWFSRGKVSLISSRHNQQ